MNSAIAHCELPLLTAKSFSPESFRDALEVTARSLFISRTSDFVLSIVFALYSFI